MKWDNNHGIEARAIRAASNEINRSKALSLMLDDYGEGLSITENIVSAAAGNTSKETILIITLLERRVEEISITEKVVRAASNNLESGEGLMTVPLKGA